MMLKAAEPFTTSSQLLHRRDGAGKIRMAAERFCKELLVSERRTSGDTNALITEYDNVQLNALITQVTPYLKRQDEAGKLGSIRQSTNPGNHDDDVPSKETLKVCLGNLRRFKRDYLN